MADYVWARDGQILGAQRVAGTDADEVEQLPLRAIARYLDRGLIKLKPPASEQGAFSVLIGDGVALAYTVTHNKGTNAVVVAVREATGAQAYVFPGIEAGTDPLNQIVVRFNTAPALNAYRVMVR